MPPINTLTFPSFYAECAYRDGERAIREGKPDMIASYMNHGDPEPLGVAWFTKGVQAARLGLVA